MCINKNNIIGIVSDTISTIGNNPSFIYGIYAKMAIMTIIVDVSAVTTILTEGHYATVANMRA